MAILSLAASVALLAAPAPLALDGQFAVAWRRPLVMPELLEYKPFEPAGPQVDPATGVVVVATRDGFVRAFDAEGKQLWYFEGRGPYIGAPGVGGGIAVIGGIDGHVVALDVVSGIGRWQYQYKEEIGAQPVFDGDLVYLATLEGTVLALEAKTGMWKWHFRREPTARFAILGIGRPAIANGVLYQGFSDGSVVALDAKTGSVKWDRKVGRGDYPDVNASVQLSRDRVYVASYGGEVAALDSANGNLVWETKVPLSYKARLDGDLLFVVSTSSVLALDAHTGKQVWTAPLEGTPFADPFPLKGLVLVANGKGLLVLDRRNGKKLRVFTRGSGASAAPSVLGKRLYGLSNVGELVAVDLNLK
ncbi:MAG TPA: PQQ-binding-like beta-propeller repeat protein [Anaeromyxobacteraceae bacterium]|nr:PQQ-binding-like beta-propeller repeat protein [Anaeromyxobacteraceae bacterium]